MEYQLLEWSWSSVVFLGLVLSVICLWIVSTDLVVYQRSSDYVPGDNVSAIARMRVREEASKVLMFALFVYIAYLSLQAPDPPSVPRRIWLLDLWLVGVALFKLINSFLYLHERRARNLFRKNHHES